MHKKYGFELLEERKIKEIASRAKLYRHKKTGARLLSILNGDENKTFGITFRTPPKDNTGVAHILEHSVLCGSRKYPVKEPFVELLKGSLQTFLNAMTYPDKTCYPVASQNLRDFYNLVDVYLDAVFFPRISKEIFAQEGWHYELHNPDEPLRYKGVVYNEMKGAYSSADNLLAEYAQQSLFPDTPYSLDSGGNPEHIPDLTYEQFKEFHRRYYHPSNAWIFFYGDDQEEMRFKALSSYLDQFEPLTIDSRIPEQKALNLEKKIRKVYMASEDNSKAMLTVNWLLPTTFDPETNLSLRILDYILIGMPASPFRKALVDSGLGEDLAGVGLETDLMHLFYSTGLKGVTSDNLDRVEELIFSTLKNIVAEGLSKDIIQAAVNTIEFALRENNTGSFPRGLAVMLRALTTWLYGQSPFLLMEFEPVLARIKDKINKGPLFEQLIDKYFLQNKHRTTLVLEPDKDLEKQLREKEHKRLLQVKESLSPQELDRIIEETKKLEQMQAAPDSPEALATIPRLKRDDLDKKIKKIPLEEENINGISVLIHPLPTSGIFYIDLGLNIHLLPQKYLSYVPLFGRALLEMGTRFEDFVSLTTRIRRKTGGIFAQPLASQVLGEQDCTAWLFLRGKTLPENLKEMLNIYKDVLLDLNLDNRERFRQIVLEEKAGLEESLVPQGHRYVAMRLKARFSEADWAMEHMSGISYLLFLRYLLDQIDNNWDQVLRTLEEIKFLLIHKDALLLNVTTESRLWEKHSQDFHDFLTLFPKRFISDSKWLPGSLCDNEAMVLPAQVNYVGQAVNLFAKDYVFHGSSLVGTRFLRTGLLWEKIRVMGGAYGAFCSFDHLTGVMTFVSYRDPNVLSTIEVFNQAGEFLSTNPLPEEEIDKAIIGTIGDMDSYQFPDAKGFSSLIRYLTKIDDQVRQKIRNEVLETDRKDLQSFGLSLDKARSERLISIMGNKAKLEEALKEGLDIANVFSLL